MILADGHEVHYSTNRGGEIDFSWTMKGNHILKVTAHAAPPLTATPGFRQYDLHIDGQSFFTMVSECSVYILSIYQPFLFIFLVGISSWSILGTANHNQAQSVWTWDKRPAFRCRSSTRSLSSCCRCILSTIYAVWSSDWSIYTCSPISWRSKLLLLLLLLLLSRHGNWTPIKCFYGNPQKFRSRFYFRRNKSYKQQLRLLWKNPVHFCRQDRTLRTQAWLSRRLQRQMNLTCSVSQSLALHQLCKYHDWKALPFILFLLPKLRASYHHRFILAVK